LAASVSKGNANGQGVKIVTRKLPRARFVRIVPNAVIDLTRSQFEQNLVDNGLAATPKGGANDVTVYPNGNIQIRSGTTPVRLVLDSIAIGAAARAETP
jgi:hypothetical protein